MGRPLSRTLSSPLVALSPIGSPQECQVPTVHTFTTGWLKTFYLSIYIYITGVPKAELADLGIKILHVKLTC